MSATSETQTNLSTSPIRLDFNNMMVEAVGTEHGIAASQLDNLAYQVSRYSEALVAERESGLLPFMDLPYRSEHLQEALDAAAELRGSYDDVVVLGIGGSALGMIALQTALLHPYHNFLPPERRKGPRIFVLDNVDPVQFEGLMSLLDPARVLFNVITKSGSTAETMAQFLIVRDWLKEALGNSYVNRLLVTTDPEKGPLRRLCKKEGYRSFVVPEGVGGRFSVLSPVGLVPAALVGIDITTLLAGAAAMDARCRATDLWKNPAYLLAALYYLAHVLKNKPLCVMMPYAYALKDVADWFRQLWAESLGKRVALDGRVVHCGPTPIKALGVTDQHSQIQLYVEGPFDKVVTFLAVEDFSDEVEIPKGMETEEGVGYLCGHTLNELLEAELRGTRIALTEANRPNMTIYLPCVSAHTVGQLLYMLEVATVMAGSLYGINPFDQPGVEAGKIATYALLGRKGYEERRAKILSAPPPLEKYIL